MKKQLKTKTDPDLARVLAATKGLTPAQAARASNDLIGASTIANWRKGHVRRPQHYTMTGALKAAGYGFAIMPLAEIKKIRSGK